MEKLRNRSDAGRLLAGPLAAYAGNPSVVVLGLPRGGAVVAAEVAHALGAPLDVFVVIRLGVPSDRRRLTVGALTTGDVLVFDEQILHTMRIPEEKFLAHVELAREELTRREHVFRGERPPLDVRGKTVVLVDDGVVTGATMRTAIAALRQKEPAAILVASPITPASALASLKREADGLATLVVAPDYPLLPLGEFYAEIDEVSEADVRALLDRAEARAHAAEAARHAPRKAAASRASAAAPRAAPARSAPVEPPVHRLVKSPPWTIRRAASRSAGSPWLDLLVDLPGHPIPEAHAHARLPDAIESAPHLYRALLENDHVRVLEFQCRPGERSHMHHHPACVVYALAEATVRVTFAGGGGDTIHFAPGEVLWVGPREHATENVGTTEAHLLIVEMKLPVP